MKQKADEIRELEISDIQQKVNALEKELYALASQSRASAVEKPHIFKELRKQIARCKTIIREKEITNAGK